MLATLARRVFYESIFTNADGFPQRSPNDDEGLAMGLNLRLNDALSAEDKNSGSEESNHSDEDSDGDSDRDYN